jgi:hypothetical protein
MIWQPYDFFRNSMTPNTEWKKAGLSVGAAAIFFLICILAYTTFHGMSGGYALAVISFFLAISSAVVSLLFVHRARVMDTILADPSPLAHWTYPEETARANVEREYREYQGRNRAMFIVIGGMLVLVALFFLIFVGDGGLETGLFLLVFAAFLFVVSRVTPWLERRRAMKASHEAVITREGVVYEGGVYPFRSFLVFWGGVTFREADRKGPAALVFSFTPLVGRFIVQPFDVVVPVPFGEEEWAGRVIRELGGEVPEEMVKTGDTPL